MNGDYFEIKGKYSDFITGARYALQSLFGIKSGLSGIIKVPVRPVQVHRNETVMSQAVHVYHHEGKELPGFVPCGYCGGKGYTMDGSIKRDCPMCSATYKYSGPETGYIFMTGKKVR